MQDVPQKPKINAEWYKELKEEFNASYFTQLKNKLVEEKKNHTIYPPGSQIFRAYDETPFWKVKVVILGQDPYHCPGQAHGLCFSVSKGVTPPPSLKNIYKELNADTGISIPTHGDLSSWTDKGVFLLNAFLTVRMKQPGSHKDLGWEQFTNASINALSNKREHLVFMLWGKFAQNKKHLIDGSKHLILEAAHPSPFSAHSGFFGCSHFSKANSYLQKHGQEPIDWSV